MSLSGECYLKFHTLTHHVASLSLTPIFHNLLPDLLLSIQPEKLAGYRVPLPHWNISLSGQALVLVLLGVCLTWCPAPNRCSEMLVEWVDGMQRDLSPFHIVIIFLSMSREAGTEAELCLCCPRGYRQQSSQVLSLEDLRQRLTLLGPPSPSILSPNTAQLCKHPGLSSTLVYWRSSRPSILGEV